MAAAFCSRFPTRSIDFCGYSLCCEYWKMASNKEVIREGKLTTKGQWMRLIRVLTRWPLKEGLSLVDSRWSLVDVDRNRMFVIELGAEKRYQLC
jgi:hypothetical protein